MEVFDINGQIISPLAGKTLYVVIVMLKLKYHVFGVCMGFLLIHIFLIFNLIFIAYQLNKKQGVKKGV